MATKLGPVEIPLTLDVSEINRQLDQIEQGVRIKRPAIAKAAETSTTTPGIVPGKLTPSQRKRDQEAFLANVTGAVIKRAGGGLGGHPLATTAHNLIGQAQAALPAPEDPARPGAIRRGLGLAGKAMVAAGIAFQTVKILPQAAAFGQAIGGDNTLSTPEGGERTFHEALENIRTRMVELESKVSSIFTSFDKTVKFNRAAERITGKLPDSLSYMKLFQQTDEGQKQLDAKFDAWKNREAPWVTAQTVIDLMKRSMGK